MHYNKKPATCGLVMLSLLRKLQSVNLQGLNLFFSFLLAVV
jgi:hypothetical protein